MKPFSKKPGPRYMRGGMVIGGHSHPAVCHGSVYETQKQEKLSILLLETIVQAMRQAQRSR